MSAVVCGKRSFFEDLESPAGSPASSPPAYKRFRCSSPARFTYSPPVQPSAVDQLKALFPDMQTQLIEKALEEASYDIDFAINMLNELNLEHEKQKMGLTAEEKSNIEGAKPVDVAGTPSGEPQSQNNLPIDGAAWVDLIVKEMMSATSIEDARSKASRVLESLEKAISFQTGAKVAEGLHKENMMLKEQIEALLRNNTILKRAVSIQHERQKEYDERNAEVQQLKQVLGQYQEQMRTLEVSNYALTMHLRQAEQSNSIPGRFHPDIF